MSAVVKGCPIAARNRPTPSPALQSVLFLARIRNRGRIQPAHEPLEIAKHVLALEWRLEIDVSSARIDVELHSLVQRFQRFVEFPSLA